MTIAIVLSLMIQNNFAQGSNPFFQKWDTPYEVPPFEQLTVDHYREAFYKGMQEQQAEIKAIVSNPEKANFQNTIASYDASGQLLRIVSAVFFGVSGAQSSPELLTLQTEITPALTKHSDEIMLNQLLFERVKHVYDYLETSSISLSKEEKRLLLELYRDFVRGGALLSETEKEKLKQINEEISRLQTQFGQNLLAETASYKLIIDKKEDLSGLPEDLIAAASNRAVKAGLKDRWVFGLDNPSIMPFLQSADKRELRRQILNAYLNRCNNNNDKDNKAIIKKLVTLRDNKAVLLGYGNFAEYALETRMAKTPRTVYDLLDQIWAPALKMARQERDDMQAMIGGAFTLEACDWKYYSEKIKQQKYNLSDEMMRPYFKSENVRDGIFWVCNRLYGISFTELKNIPKPHPDAQAFLCKDADGETELGVLFIDLYARPGFKRGGAWCGSYRTQYYEGNKRILPLTTIVCNFTPPVGTDPALLTADEVETFFHEFGHALHNLFKNIRYHGTASVSRDFVELPSQIMEHWAFQPLVLAQYARHYRTGEVIPQQLIDKMTAASRFGQGFATVEYLAASYLDMDYHVETSPQALDVLKFEAATLEKRGLIPQIPPRYRSTYFQHTMTGGYTAGYYSYIWSEVLDCDGFQAFVESGDLFNKQLAGRFRKYILEPGCIDDPMDMYLNFRQKQPVIDALLENRGLK